ncbi:MAG TPA: alpha/beta fold hydrolase [Dactylosporangium sp.]|jgi:surfactin synthase thioesterase subunit|nr:alpha/beta fold hydrolase [Dactylosporangium sp.]
MAATGNRTDDTGAWVRRYHPADDAAVRLVCFPHAGGSATFYRPMSAALSPAVDVLALQYPGRQDRRHTPGIEHLPDLADAVFEALLPWTDRPFAFFGHSMGAIVAFEVALRLRSAARNGPVRLFASGRRAPSRWREGRVHLLDDAGIIAELRGLSGSDPRILGDEELLPMILPALRADYRAIERYTCEPAARVACPVTVLTGNADPQVDMDDACAWERHTDGGLTLRVFTGGHFFLTDHAAELLRLIRQDLVGTAAARR